MYIAMNRFRIARGAEATFEKLWRERESQLDGVPGFREFHLLRIKLIRESASLEAYALQVHQEWTRYIARALAKRMQVNAITDLRPLLLASCGVVAMRVALVPWVQTRGATDISVFTRQAFDQIQLGFPG